MSTPTDTPTDTTTDTRIYLDRSQCDRFSIQGADAYFDEGKVLVAASTLLKSKGGDGYDEDHKSALEPLGSKTVILTREESDAPGWFSIERVV